VHIVHDFMHRVAKLLTTGSIAVPDSSSQLWLMHRNPRTPRVPI